MSNTVTLCRNCKHWVEPGRMNSEFGTCGLGDGDNSNGKPMPENTETLAFGGGGEWYNTQMYTKPNFGCVQGESAHA